jgi:hypothetical protein
MVEKYSLKMTIVAMILLPCSSNAAGTVLGNLKSARRHVDQADQSIQTTADHRLDGAYESLFERRNTENPKERGSVHARLKETEENRLER